MFEKAWVHIDPKIAFGDKTHYGKPTMDGMKIAGELQMQPRVDAPYGNISKELSEATDPDKFRFTRTDGSGVSFDILKRVKAPNNAKRWLYEYTLDRQKMHQAEAGLPKYRAHLGFKHEDGCDLMWGEEFWLGTQVLLAPEFNQCNVKDTFMLLQGFTYLDHPGDSDNPALGITFVPGGSTTPGNASIRTTVRRQLTPHYLDHVASRALTGTSLLDSETVQDVRMAGWPAGKLVTIIVRGRHGFYDAASQVPANQVLYPMAGTLPPFLEVWVKFGTAAPVRLLRHDGRWGNNDKRPCTFNSGPYYYGSPPLWSGPAPVGGAAAVRTVHSAGLLGYRHRDRTDMTVAKMCREVAQLGVIA